MSLIQTNAKCHLYEAIKMLPLTCISFLKTRSVHGSYKNNLDGN